MLLTEFQIDRTIRQWRAYLMGGLAFMLLPFALPQGWRFGLFTGFMLFSLGIYGFCLRRWRTDRGLWMLAVLLTVTLGPCCAYFEYWHWRGVFTPPDGNQAIRKFTWEQTRLSVDAGIALWLLARSVKLAMSVSIENWKRTRSSEQSQAA